jgi:Na+/glutamate symporter
MSNNYAELFKDANKLKICSVKVGTPAITVGAVIGAIVGRHVQNWLDGFRHNLEDEKRFMNQMRKDPNLYRTRLIATSTLAELIALRINIISKT